MILIRPARPDEFERVADILTAAYAPFMSDDADYMAELRDTAKRAAASEVLVAAEGEAVLGTITFVPDGGLMSEVARPGETEFRMFGVDPATRGRGIGLALMTHIVEATRGAGKSGIACSSRAEMTAAHRIYERLGFRRDPSRDWSPVPGIDLLAFALTF